MPGDAEHGPRVVVVHHTDEAVLRRGDLALHRTEAEVGAAGAGDLVGEEPVEAVAGGALDRIAQQDVAEIAV